jgi:ASC-1-like (ASCH) protein
MAKDYIEFYQILLQLNMNIKETKKNIIQAGQKAVEELIKVAKEPIVDSDDDISADRLKNAAATKKLAIFDAFEILNRIQEEENLLEGKEVEEKKERVFKGFAEGRSK